MRKALVVSDRGRLLTGLLAAIGGPELTVLAEPSLAAGARRVRTERIDLVVVDVATLSPADQPLLPTVRAGLADAALLCIVPADRPRHLRAALRAGADGLLLDPFDLEEGERVISKLLAARGAPLSGHDSLDALATFLKGLAHEILNPLMSVSGILQLLRKDPAATPELKARYETMWQGSERIHKTVRELEYFVRTKKPQRSRFDPAGFARETVDKWRAGDPPLAVTLTAPEAAAPVLGDAEQIAAALRHLARFAAGPDGRGAVALDVEPASGQVEFTVRGATPIRLPSRPADLLVPYQDAHGTGRSGSLELAAAYGIFRSHKGTIDVAAEPSGGVRFRAVLPLPPELAMDGER